jgi:hypothetical protein
MQTEVEGGKTRIRILVSAGEEVGSEEEDDRVSLRLTNKLSLVCLVRGGERGNNHQPMEGRSSIPFASSSSACVSHGKGNHLSLLPWYDYLSICALILCNWIE